MVSMFVCLSLGHLKSMVQCSQIFSRKLLENCLRRCSDFKFEPYLKSPYLLIERQKAVVATAFLQVIFVRLAPDTSQFVSVGKPKKQFI